MSPLPRRSPFQEHVVYPIMRAWLSPGYSVASLRVRDGWFRYGIVIDQRWWHL